MNEREENKELTQRIAETLRSHAEPYKEGAWERYVTAYGKPKRRVLWWPYWSAAAALLLAVGVFWHIRRPNAPDGMQPEIAQHDASTPQRVAPEAIEVPITGQGPGDEALVPQTSLVQIQTSDGRHVEASEGERLLPAVNLAEVRIDTVAAQYTAIQDATPRGAVALPDTAKGTETNPIPQRLATTAEEYTPEQPAERFPRNGLVDQEPVNPTYAVATNKPESPMGKWDLGLVVSPSLTSEQVNMGGGIAVAYRLSDKFSLGSGVSIGQLGVGQNRNYEPGVAYSDIQNSLNPNTGSNGFVADARAYREETSVTSNVVTLDIPFDLRYEVAKGFYTSVGVSYVAVLDEQRTSHFVSGLNERTLEDKYAGDKDLAAAVEAVFSEEKIAAQPLKGKGYAGFVNFSIGRKIPLSSKLSIAVEPYFKLPIGRLSQADMDFTNGGIRIVTGF